MRYPSRLPFAIPLFALTLLGAGCLGGADPLTGIETGLDAMQEAETLTEDAQATARRMEDSLENKLPIAFVLTEGSMRPESGVDRYGETIGCGDTIAYVRVSRETESNWVSADALRTLLSVEETTYDGLHNSLASSGLTLDDVRSPDGVTVQYLLVGMPSFGGACDVPRVKAQVESTVAQYRPTYEILLNGSASEWRCLGDQSGECL